MQCEIIHLIYIIIITTRVASHRVRYKSERFFHAQLHQRHARLIAGMFTGVEGSMHASILIPQLELFVQTSVIGHLFPAPYYFGVILLCDTMVFSKVIDQYNWKG